MKKTSQGLFRYSPRRMKLRPKVMSKNVFRGKHKPASLSAK